VELLEPGFRHDICATVQALIPLSPAMSSLAVDLVPPPVPLAHPLDDGSAVLLRRSVEETARGLGGDAGAYRRLVGPLVRHAGALFLAVLGPVVHLPRHPLLLARLGVPGLLPASRLASLVFREPRARALLAGAAAHSLLSLHEPVTGAYGLVMLVSAHAGGWAFARGGSSAVANALVKSLEAHGAEIRCGEPVASLKDLPASRAVMLDLVPKGVLEVAGDALPAGYRRWLARYRYGPGVFKLDWTLDGPIPWRAEECRLAGTVHLGGSYEEIASSEDDVAPGRSAGWVEEGGLREQDKRTLRVPAMRHVILDKFKTCVKTPLSWLAENKIDVVLIDPQYGDALTKDEHYLSFCCLQAGKYWPPLTEILGRPELAQDPRFADHALLLQNTVEVQEILRAAFAEYTVAEWREKLADFTGQWCVVQDTLEAATKGRAVTQIFEGERRFGLVVKVAGIGLFSPFETTTDETMRGVFETNLFGPIEIMRVAIPHLREHGGGRIVNLSSASSIVPEPLMGIYNASKAAVISLTRTLAADALFASGAAWGIKVVNAVA